MKNKLNIIKKHLVGIIISTSLFAFNLETNAFISINNGGDGTFLSGDLGLDLYNQINSGFENLQSQYYQKDLKGGSGNGTINKQLNDLARLYNKKECINSNEISFEDFQAFVNRQITNIGYIIKDDCLKDGAIPIEVIEDFFSLVDLLEVKARSSSKEKTKNNYNISHIGLYSDGNNDNSPFDLITDIEEIDKIIFKDESTYNGTNDDDNDGITSDINGGYTNNNSNNNSDKLNTKVESKNYGSINDLINSNILSSDDEMCVINDSGLNQDIIEELGVLNTCSPLGIKTNDKCCEGLESKKIGDDEVCVKPKEEDESIKCKYINTEQEGYYYVNKIGIVGDLLYKTDCSNRMYDNLGWLEGDSGSGGSGVSEDSFPCASFFCIMIEFKTYTQNLLGGSAAKTIESIVARSNKHIYKGVSASKVQGRMTANNWEIGLRDLNLPDIFSLGIQVEWKSPPILNLGANKEEEKNQDKSNTQDRASKVIEDMLVEEYKAGGLDYIRENDLNNFIKADEEAVSIINSIELSAQNAIKRRQQVEELSKYKSITTEINLTQINAESNNDFYQQFTELERFIDNLNGSYTKRIHDIIKQMNLIPTGKN